MVFLKVGVVCLFVIKVNTWSIGYGQAEQHQPKQRLSKHQQDIARQEHFVNKRPEHPDLHQKPRSQQQQHFEVKREEQPILQQKTLPFIEQHHFIVKRRAQPDQQPQPKNGGDSQGSTNETGDSSLGNRYAFKVGKNGIIVTVFLLGCLFCVLIFLIFYYWKPNACIGNY